MTASFHLIDSHGTKVGVKVTKYGQLVASPIDFSTAYTATIAIVDTAYIIASPVSGERFVITDIILDAGKDVSGTTAGTVVLYETSAEDSVTVDTKILSVEMLKNTNRVITGINMITTSGQWINIKSTDATVEATILGYYIKNGS